MYLVMSVDSLLLWLLDLGTRSFFNLNRDETGTSTTVDADVDALYAGGQAKWGTDESVFIKVLASRSYAHLAAVSKGLIHYSSHSSLCS